MLAFFITATGTDIGKTFVTAALARHWLAAGRKVRVLKPVLSGFDPADAAASDAGVLLEAIGQSVQDAAALDRISPFRFEAPLSPDMAASRENRKIDLADVLAHCRAAIAERPDVLLIEGVGGAMVPLNARATVLDWMAELRLPVLMVAGSYLGTISHSLTAIAALQARKVDLAGLLVNESPESPAPLDETLRAIAAHTRGLPIEALPRNPDADALAGLAATLERIIAG